MKLEKVDLLLWAVCNLPIIFILGKSWKNKKYPWDELLVLCLLWLKHQIASFFFASYILTKGGDSPRLWYLTADTSQYANTWIEHFGISTFFIQWVNYIPSKLFNFSYWSGTIIYATISYGALVLIFFGFRELYQRYRRDYVNPFILYLPLFLPGLHFWTAGVTKESLLLLGLASMFYSYCGITPKIFLGVTGWILCLMTKPLVGLFFLPLLLWSLIPFFKQSWFLALTLFTTLSWLLFKASRQFISYLHLENFSWEGLMIFSQSQLVFLNSYQADTAVAMMEMNYLERWIAVLFRPFLWEVWDFYSFIYALENTWFLLLVSASIVVLITSWRFHLPFLAKYYLIIALGMILVFTFTLNNFGLFYRMKSVWMPFLQFPLLWLICNAGLQFKQSP